MIFFCAILLYTLSLSAAVPPMDDATGNARWREYFATLRLPNPDLRLSPSGYESLFLSEESVHNLFCEAGELRLGNEQFEISLMQQMEILMERANTQRNPLTGLLREQKSDSPLVKFVCNLLALDSASPTQNYYSNCALAIELTTVRPSDMILTNRIRDLLACSDNIPEAFNFLQRCGIGIKNVSNDVHSLKEIVCRFIHRQCVNYDIVDPQLREYMDSSTPMSDLNGVNRDWRMVVRNRRLLLSNNIISGLGWLKIG